jgi:hypothetical protein
MQMKSARGIRTMPPPPNIHRGWRTRGILCELLANPTGIASTSNRIARPWMVCWYSLPQRHTAKYSLLFALVPTHYSRDAVHVQRHRRDEFFNNSQVTLHAGSVALFAFK